MWTNIHSLASNRCFDPCLFWDISYVDNSSLNFQKVCRQTNMSLTVSMWDLSKFTIFFKEAPERLECSDIPPVAPHKGVRNTPSQSMHASLMPMLLAHGFYASVSASSVRRISGSSEFECCFQHLGNHLIPNKNWIIIFLSRRSQILENSWLLQGKCPFLLRNIWWEGMTGRQKHTYKT